MLETVPLRPFERDPALKQLVKNYEQTSNFVRFVDDLDAFFAENALYPTADADLATAEAIKDEDVRLICFERLLPLL